MFSWRAKLCHDQPNGHGARRLVRDAARFSDGLRGDDENPRGSVYTTLEYKINILRGLPLGMEIDCIGVTDHVGRSTGVAHGEIRGVEDGKLYATGSTTCIVMKLA